MQNKFILKKKHNTLNLMRLG